MYMASHIIYPVKSFVVVVVLFLFPRSSILFIFYSFGPWERRDVKVICTSTAFTLPRMKFFFLLLLTKKWPNFKKIRIKSESLVTPFCIFLPYFFFKLLFIFSSSSLLCITNQVERDGYILLLSPARVRAVTAVAIYDTHIVCQGPSSSSSSF